MPRKITVRANDEEVEATATDFETLEETWNKYRIPESGDIIEIKLVATEIFQTGVMDKKTQEPIYAVRSQNVMRVVPEE